jgi:hypothetical protein
MSRQDEFAQGQAPACPECGSTGRPDGPGTYGHAGDTPASCHHYTWNREGTTVARDVSTKGQRDERANRIDARIGKLAFWRR